MSEARRRETGQALWPGRGEATRGSEETGRGGSEP